MRAIVLILALLISWSICQAGDRYEVAWRARELINEKSTETKKHWEDSTLDWSVNDAQFLISGLVSVMQAETTYALVSGTINYVLPGDFYIREAALFKRNLAVTSNVWEEPRYLPHRRKKDIGTGYNPERGPVQVCSIWGDSIMFWPTPRTDDLVTLYYVANPDTLNTDTTTLQVPPPMVALIPHYIAAKCWLKAKDSRATGAMQFFMESLAALAARYEDALKSEYVVPQSSTAPVTVSEP